MIIANNGLCLTSPKKEWEKIKNMLFYGCAEWLFWIYYFFIMCCKEASYPSISDGGPSDKLGDLWRDVNLPGDPRPTTRPDDILYICVICLINIKISDRVYCSDLISINFYCPTFSIISAVKPPGLLSAYHLLFPPENSLPPAWAQWKTNRRSLACVTRWW